MDIPKILENSASSSGVIALFWNFWPNLARFCGVAKVLYSVLEQS